MDSRKPSHFSNHGSGGCCRKKSAERTIQKGKERKRESEGRRKGGSEGGSYQEKMRERGK